VVLTRGEWRWIAAKGLAHLGALLPLAGMVRDALSDALGADPVAALTHRTGDWALRLLLLCLAMTPLRRVLGAPWPVRFRRLLGLYSFFYAGLHLSVYLVLDLQGYWMQVLEDVVKRPFVTAGAATLLLLLPLAATSTRGWMRRLGSRWGKLHRLAYVAAATGVLHFWWGVKADIREPALYAAILAGLLGVRVGWWWKARRAPAGA
jgi:sulfoxide reductase heme-binding subunit YedZ